MTHGTRKSRAELKRKQHGWTNGRLTADIYEARERIAELEAALHKINSINDNPGRFNANMQAVLARTQSTLCDVAQLIDGAIKDESWSEWDQSVRDAVTARMTEIERLIK